MDSSKIHVTDEFNKLIYTIHKTALIGSGKYSNVYYTTIKVPKSKTYECVSKIISKNYINYDNKRINYNISRLKIEEEVMRTVKHPNIIKFISKADIDDSWCFFMEYCNSGTLKLIIKNNKNRLESDIELITKHYLIQLRDAIICLKNNGFIHRDIKPKNILLKSSNKFLCLQNENIPAYTLKLGDFGFATKIKSDTEIINDSVGSPFWMSPESLLTNKYNSKNELWAFGIIMYELLYGILPYTCHTKEELLSQLQDIHIDDFSLPCRDLISKCLKFDHNQRISWDKFNNHPWFDVNNSQYNYLKQLIMDMYNI